MLGTDITPLCAARGWTRSRLIAELRQAARDRKIELPGDDSLRRMLRGWANGHRGISEFYAELLTAVFGASFSTGGIDRRGGAAERDAQGLQDELGARLSAAAAMDGELVRLLEDQTQTLRLLDRRLGAYDLLDETERHLTTITDLLAYTTHTRWRGELAAAAAEAAALAGWQALDLGDAHQAWRHHETAKAAAHDVGSTAILAHVTAQQGYALLDLGRRNEAVELIRNVREGAQDHVPAVLSSWLWAAEGEALASLGDEASSVAALDEAGHLLSEADRHPDLPFIVLNETHLRRWRGHCLAQLGSATAVDELSTALASLDPSFNRAAAALQCDLALAYTKRGEHDAACDAAQRASELAAQTMSVRQRRRLKRLTIRETQSGR